MPHPTRLRRARAAFVTIVLLTALAGCLPHWPSPLPAPTIGNVAPTSFDVDWTPALVDTDASVDQYEVSLDGVVRVAVDGATLHTSLTGLAPDTQYALRIRAHDTKGQWSNPSLDAAVTTAPATVAITEAHTIDHGGLARDYRLDIPAGYTGADGATVVVALHGGGGSPDSFAVGTGFPAVAQAHGFVVAYPAGSKGGAGFRTWNAGGCCGGAVAGNVDDVGFVADVIAELRARFHTNNVVLMGHSNGAMLSYRIACERASIVDAIGVASGPLFVSPCTPSKPVPLLHIHGLLDTMVPFTGGPGVSGVTYPPAIDGVEIIGSTNGCGSPATSVDVAGVVTATYPCPTGATVQLITIDDGTHTWPDGKDSNVTGPATHKLNASRTFAAFFDSL